MRVIATHAGLWRLMLASQAAAVVMTVAGLAVVASSLGSADVGVQARFGVIVFLVGAFGMLGYLGFHFTTTPHPSGTYEEQRRRYARGYRAYMVLSYAVFAYVGLSFAFHHVLGLWLGWVLAAAGVTGAVTMVVRKPNVRGLLVSDLPLWIHVLAGVLGVALVSRR